MIFIISCAANINQSNQIMFKRQLMLIALLLLTLTGVNAQRVLRMGSGNLTLQDNATAVEQGRVSLPEATTAKGQVVVLRFDQLPTAKQKAEMRKQGIELHAYISHNMYYATVKGSAAVEALQLACAATRSANKPMVKQVAQVDPLWKVSPEVSSGRIPEWARGEKAGKARIIVEFFKWAKTDEVANQLKNSGIRIVNMMEQFRMVEVEMPVANALQLAENDWVRWIGFVAPPAELENWQGRTMSRVNVLSQVVTMGGYNLTGKGQEVGIWDGDIERHADLGERLRSHEFVQPSPVAHGQHTSGTLAGAGILDPRAKGMAPEAIVHAWNFSATDEKWNGMNTPQKMSYSASKFNVRVTSNSYGVSQANFCKSPYAYQGNDPSLDLLTNELYPDMLHFFSAGNDQDRCEGNSLYAYDHYGTSTKRAKNVVMVGALNENEEMTDFSSWGPMPDGRLLPHVSIMGESVYSTVYSNQYAGGPVYSGTSMACPAAAGTATLLYEYYQRLHGKKPLASLAKALILNGARDLGNAGPDYQFGYGVVDGLRSVRMVENNQWFVDAVDQAESKTFSINVPANTAELRVMLVWSDVPSPSGTYGEIVNDLDLTVEKDGSINYPWVLDPKNPEKPATRGIDHINNQEQVLISNPAAGTYTIKVNGYAIPEGPQQFAVVYDFYAKGVEVTFPNGNDVLVPGDVHVARWNTSGLTDKIRVELSTDGGKTFQVIARDLPANATHCSFTVPNASTDKAILKVQQGANVDMSDAPFVIMGVPQNVQATSVTPCAADSWQLVWDAVPGAAQYAVLKVNPDNGITTEIARTATTTYNLPAITDKRNLYSVAAVSAEGVVSQRSYAAQADVSMPVVVTATKAFVEEFENIPSDYVTLKLGQYVVAEYQATFAHSVAHLIKFRGTGGNNAWNANGDLFANNPDNVASARICDVDATSLAGKPLWLRVANMVGNTGASNAAYRITANGNVVNNTNGKGVISETDAVVSYYDLSAYAGQHFDLSIEAVLRNGRSGDPIPVGTNQTKRLSDSVMFGHLQLWSPKLDVSIQEFAFANVPTTNAQENVTLTLRNSSSEEMRNLQVRYRVNGGAWTTEVVAGPIKPLSSSDYTFTKKLSLDVDVLYTVEAEVLLAGDENPSNNTATTKVYRNGTDYTIMACGSTNIQLTATSTPQYFTDNGGKAGDYSGSCKSAIVISTQYDRKDASTHNKQVQLRFIEFDTKTGDVLAIHDGGFSNYRQIAALQGNGHTLPMTYVSTNGSAYGAGQIYILFESNTGGASGFLVEYMEVDDIANDPANIFTLSDILNGNGNYVSGQDVRVRIANRSGNPQNDVQVRYRVDNGSWVEETIAQLPTGNYNTHTFSEKLYVPESKATFTLEAEVLNSDMLISDNKAIKTLSNDLYCNPTSTNYDFSGVFPTRIVVDGKEFTQTKPSNTGSGSAVNNHRSTVFPLYRDVASNAMDIDFTKVASSGSISSAMMGIWVDWNDDYEFSDDEGVKVDISSISNYTHIFNLTGKTNGRHVMRIRMLGSSYSWSVVNDIDACTNSTNYGGSFDFSIEVLDSDPNAYNIGLTGFSNATSGQNLSAAETVSVNLANNGSKEATGFTLELVVDGVSVATETFAGSIAPKAIATHTFAATADLSAPGYHTVEVYANMANDADETDNYQSITIYNETPGVQAGEWTLSFDGTDDVVNAGTLDNTNLQTYTYEAWIRPNTAGGYGASGFGRVFSGKGLLLFACGSSNHSIYPKDCFVISVGDDGSYFTNLGTFNAGVWQHVAVTHNTASKETKLYLNGVEMDLNTNKAFTAMADNSTSVLYIGNSETLDRQFNGQIDNARVWNVVRSQAEIQASMDNGVSMASTDGLVAEFLFNEGPFTSTTVNSVSGVAATIHNAYFGDDDASIWQPYRVLRSFEVDNMLTGWSEIASNHYGVELQSAANIAAMVPEFVTYFDGAEVKANGNAIASGASTIDFSSPVTITATAQHRGQTLTDTYIYEAVAARQLQSLSIPALGINHSGAVPQLIEVESDADVSALATQFTTNFPATVLFNGADKASGEAVDYSTPVVIDVLGNSGVVNASYTVLVKRSQTISWGSIAQNKTYGDAKFDLTATATSGGKVVYESSNPEVISVDAGQATVVGAGQATITAHQLGHNGLKPVSDAKLFTVAKAPLTITADDKAINFSEALPELTMSFSGFVNGDDQSSLDQLPAIATTATASSPAGVYDITLTGGSDANYDFNLVNGQLTIISVTLHNITFNVTFDGAAEADATIEVNGKTLTTDAAGQATVQLMPGDYPYTVTKAGREPYSGTVTVTAPATVNVEMIAALPIYTLTYTADPLRGSINGQSPQHVKQGQDGKPVEAQANTHYVFTQWSDGIAENPRTDKNVQRNIGVTAEFDAVSYTVNYVAAEGGSLSGELSQTIKYGTTGSPVTVTPADGYGFMGWSDGRSDNPRTDSPTGDVTITALFGQVYTAPYTQTFDADTLPKDWETVMRKGSVNWIFADKANSYGGTLNGSTPNGAIFKDASGGDKDVDLVSPVFDFTKNTTVTLEFKHYYKHYRGAKATVSYSLDGGKTWVDIQSWEASTGNPDAFSKVVDAVAGKTNVRFRWNYTYSGGSYGDYWIVDDVNIIGDTDGPFTLTYRAGANGSLEGANAQGIISQVVEKGQNGPSVLAVPEPGYVFKQWSDKNTDNPRVDVAGRDIDVTAEFGLDCNVTISALPHEVDFTVLPDCWTADGNWNFDGAANIDEAGMLTSYKFDLSAYSQAYMLCDVLPYGMGYSAKLEYTTDNGASWSELQSISFGFSQSAQIINVELPTLSDAMRFRWSVVSTGGYSFGMFAVANVTITEQQYGTITYEGNWHPTQYNYFGGIEYNGTFKGEQVITDVVGTLVTVTAKPAAEWLKFSKWSDGLTEATRTDEITAGSKYLLAEFDSIMFTLTYMAAEGGSISGEVGQQVKLGFNGTSVTAVPDAGYKFVRWSDGRSDNPRTDTNVREDVTVEAEFVADNVTLFTLTYTAAEGGSISGVATQTVAEGQNGVAVTAVPNKGYRFVQWSDGNTNATRTEENVTEDMAFEAEFIKQIRVDYLAAANGSIEGAALQIVDLGSTTTAVTATPDEGYRFVRWSDGRTDATRTDVIDLAIDDTTFVAQFELIRHILTISVLGDDAQPIAAAKVTLGGKDYTTDAKGVVVDTLVPETYAYTVELSGYNTQTGEVNLVSDTLVKVILSKPSAPAPATGLFDNVVESLSVYPNPTTGGIYVEGNGDVVSIISMGAQLVLQQPVYGRTYVDLSNLPAGVYIVRLGNAQAKVIKQ